MAKTVLIVDDDKEFKAVLENLLVGEGYHVLYASNAKEGLKMLKEENIDMALVDMFMPDMSGRAMCEEMRKDKSLDNVKVVFLTMARFSDKGKQEIKKLNVSDYITKPFDDDNFLRRIKKVLKP